MKKLFDRVFWYIGLKLMTWVGALLLLCGVAYACPKGTKQQVLRQPGRVMTVCTDAAGKWQGMGFIKDGKGNLLATGRYKNGQPDGVWTTFSKGRVLTHPMFKNGKQVAEDTMTDDEAGGSDDD